MERNIKIRLITTDELPADVHGMAAPLDEDDSYIVVIREDDEQAASFLHECLHIWHKDFEKNLSVQQIESMRHKELSEILKAENHITQDSPGDHTFASIARSRS